MTGSHTADRRVTDPGRSFTDIRSDTWVDRLVPPAVQPYARLMRLDRPIGTWLLLFPCWWGLALAPRPAGYGWSDLRFALLFAIGAVVMRGAGCIINDILDRDIDARVARTRTRPIPSGQVSVRQALLFLAGLLLLGLAVLLQFNATTVGLGILSLALVLPYPLMKRITWWPQAWLGLTFNWGALVGWTAVAGTLDPPALVLYAAGLFWTLGYDTIYAHQDKEDDALVGVKSTARRLGAASRGWIAGFYLLTAAGLVLDGHLAALHPVHLAGLGLGLALLLVQLRDWRPDDPADCLAKFKAQRWFAWLVLAGFVLGRAWA